MKRTCNECAALADKRGGDGGCNLGFSNHGEMLPRGKHIVFDSWDVAPQEECPKPKTGIKLAKLFELRDYLQGRTNQGTIKKMLIEASKQ